MSVLANHFNPKINQCSPLKTDLVRHVKFDEQGIEHVIFEPFDYDKFQMSLGTVEDWALMKLIKAGIDPSFPIHTSSPTRLEVEQQVNNVAAEVEGLFNELEEEEVVIHEPEA